MTASPACPTCKHCHGTLTILVGVDGQPAGGEVTPYCAKAKEVAEQFDRRAIPTANGWCPLWEEAEN